MSGLKTALLFSLVSIFLLPDASGQFDRSGFTFSIGAGSGYSSHAASYSTEKTGGFSQIDEYPGFRILGADLKVGWGFSPRMQLSYTFKYTPPSTTISPYQSVYHGFIGSYSPKTVAELIISMGAGVNSASDKNKGALSQGTLFNIAFGYEFNPHFLLELNTLFGKMDNSPPPQSFLSSSNEFSLILTIGYMFYRDSEN